MSVGLTYLVPTTKINTVSITAKRRRESPRAKGLEQRKTNLYSASITILTPLSFAFVHILIKSACNSARAEMSSCVSGPTPVSISVFNPEAFRTSRSEERGQPGNGTSRAGSGESLEGGKGGRECVRYEESLDRDWASGRRAVCGLLLFRLTE